MKVLSLCLASFLTATFIDATGSKKPAEENRTLAEDSKKEVMLLNAVTTCTTRTFKDTDCSCLISLWDDKYYNCTRF